jgi:peptide/nickel transport system substrate-binding protein
MIASGKYDGTPIKILTSQQYEFHYRMALVMAENLKAAGFKVDMQVVDWATLIQRRNDPALWDIYITHSAVLPEPTLTPPQLGEGAPGWWSSPARRRRSGVRCRINRRSAARCGARQESSTPRSLHSVGSFNSLTARSAARWLRRDAVAVLLEHGAAEIGIVHSDGSRAITSPTASFQRSRGRRLRGCTCQPFP